MNIEITKDMIPIAEDFFSRDEAIEKMKFAQQERFNKKILKTVNDINQLIKEGASKGKIGVKIIVDDEIGNLLIEPLSNAGYKVLTAPMPISGEVIYTINWIDDKKVGDE